MDGKLIVLCILITILLVSVIAYFDESDGLLFTSAALTTSGSGGIKVPDE